MARLTCDASTEAAALYFADGATPETDMLFLRWRTATRPWRIAQQVVRTAATAQPFAEQPALVRTPAAMGHHYRAALGTKTVAVTPAGPRQLPWDVAPAGANGPSATVTDGSRLPLAALPSPSRLRVGSDADLAAGAPAAGGADVEAPEGPVAKRMRTASSPGPEPSPQRRFSLFGLGGPRGVAGAGTAGAKDSSSNAGATDSSSGSGVPGSDTKPPTAVATLRVDTLRYFPELLPLGAMPFLQHMAAPARYEGCGKKWANGVRVVLSLHLLGSFFGPVSQCGATTGGARAAVRLPRPGRQQWAPGRADPWQRGAAGPRAAAAGSLRVRAASAGTTSGLFAACSACSFPHDFCGAIYHCLTHS